jgi:hypothetical protein
MKHTNNAKRAARVKAAKATVHFPLPRRLGAVLPRPAQHQVALTALDDHLYCSDDTAVLVAGLEVYVDSDNFDMNKKPTSQPRGSTLQPADSEEVDLNDRKPRGPVLQSSDSEDSHPQEVDLNDRKPAARPRRSVLQSSDSEDSPPPGS